MQEAMRQLMDKDVPKCLSEPTSPASLERAEVRRSPPRFVSPPLFVPPFLHPHSPPLALVPAHPDACISQSEKTEGNDYVKQGKNVQAVACWRTALATCTELLQPACSPAAPGPVAPPSPPVGDGEPQLPSSTPEPVHTLMFSLHSNVSAVKLRMGEYSGRSLSPSLGVVLSLVLS
jgi:hypothetical protein